MKHLFVVPRIRTSSYVQMLADTLPDLRHSAPGNIQDAALPDLRNLVVVDNQGAYKQELDRAGVRSAIDWREVLLWREDSREAGVLKEAARSLDRDEVINLQFTRCVGVVDFQTRLIRIRQWDDGLSEGCFGTRPGIFGCGTN